MHQENEAIRQMQQSWFRRWFPQQTQSIPAIVLWLVIFALDLAAGFWLLARLGVDLTCSSGWILGNPNLGRGLGVGIILGTSGGLWAIEALIYNKLHTLFQG